MWVFHFDLTTKFEAILHHKNVAYLPPSDGSRKLWSLSLVFDSVEYLGSGRRVAYAFRVSKILVCLKMIFYFL